jgi:response regulator RpfG family c-di-GMP phosphodiesterase
MGDPEANDNGEFLKTLSLLYVEDDEETRELLGRYLGRRFKHLDTAANGAEGLESFRTNRQDVIITDIKMPQMDGLEMAEHIKAIADDIPIVVITAYSDLDCLLRSIELGIDQYVLKPVDLEKLMGALHKSVQSKFQQRELAKAQQTVTKTLEEVVDVLSRAIEIRDPYTDGHQKRVSQLAVAIGREMALPESRLLGLRLGSMIHDVGKIRVPAEVLSKPGKLSSIEMSLVREHALAGYEIVKDVSFPWPLADFVLQHHERLDGSGYPNGLKGDEILLEAKILAVADVVEAMFSHRPYRAALGLAAAVEEIRSNRGNLYDAAVVDACLAVLEKTPDPWKITPETPR